MLLPTSLLLPLDFSADAERAVPAAAALARAFDVPIVALHVVEGALPPPLEGEDDWDSDEVRALLARRDASLEPNLRERLDSLLGAVPHAVVVEPADDVSADIVERAAANRPTWIVMATHGRTGFKRFFLGSTSEKVLRQARCPVVLVPVPKRVASAPPAGSARLGSVLYPTDFSPESLAALPDLRLLANRLEAKVTCLHVCEPVWTGPFDFGGLEDVLERQVRTAAEERLGKLVAAELEGVEAGAEVVFGRAATEILHRAEHDVDLIVMARHGGSGARRWLLGSVALKVLRQATCPVFLIPRSDPEPG